MYPIIDLHYLQIPTYTICTGLGGIACAWLLTRLLLKKDLLLEYIDLCVIAIIGLFAGARFFGIMSRALSVRYATGRWNLSESLNSGIVYLGGLLGYLTALQILCRIKRRPFSRISNEIAVVIPLFHVFGRIGCFFAGCCYGRCSDSMLAIPYPDRLNNNAIAYRLPVQLYEAGFELLLFFILLWIYYRNGKHLLHIYLTAYAVWRFSAEFLRGDDKRGVFYGISFSQIICAMMAITIFIKYKAIKGEKNG